MNRSGDQIASKLYPNPRYNDACYIEVWLYYPVWHENEIMVEFTKMRTKFGYKNNKQLQDKQTT